jgi:ubiquitin-protein ligase
MSKAPSPPQSTASPSATTKRLLHELRDYASSPNEALLHLAPIRDEELMKWEAVLKGPQGSAYEGASLPMPSPLRFDTVPSLHSTH